MKIRNLPFDKLNNKEKKVILLHYGHNTCGNKKCMNSVQDFWEVHRKTDTHNGNYDGWFEPPDELEDIMEEKLKQIKENKNE